MRRVLLLLFILGCGGSDSAGNSTDAASDTGTSDGALARDVVLQVDAVVGEDGASDAGDGATACVPGDVSGYTASWHPPSPPQARCTDAQLDQLISSCFGAASSQAACSAFRLANALCYACTVTPDGDPTWGPVIHSSQTTLYYGNYGGCLALVTGDTSASGCGSRAEAAQSCTDLACSGADCPVRTQADISALNACANQAFQGGCGSYGVEQSVCVNALLADGGAGASAVQLCRFSTYGDLPTYWRALAGMFCGPQAGDGGAEGGTADGSSDAGLPDSASDGRADSDGGSTDAQNEAD